MAISDKHDYVGVLPGASTVFVIVADRAKFDSIPRPVTDHGDRSDGLHVLTKTVGDHYADPELHGMVIFQHWIESDGESAPVAVLEAKA